MNGENQPLVTDELVEFENTWLKFKTIGKFTDHFRGIQGKNFKLVKENQKMSTCNRLDLETLGSRPIMPKNLPGHWCCYPAVLILRRDPGGGRINLVVQSKYTGLSLDSVRITSSSFLRSNMLEEVLNKLAHIEYEEVYRAQATSKTINNVIESEYFRIHLFWEACHAEEGSFTCCFIYLKKGSSNVRDLMCERVSGGPCHHSNPLIHLRPKPFSKNRLLPEEVDQSVPTFRDSSSDGRMIICNLITWEFREFATVDPLSTPSVHPRLCSIVKLNLTK